MRGFLISSIRVARRAAMVGRDVLIAPPTRNEDKPDPCEVKQNKGIRKENHVAQNTASNHTFAIVRNVLDDPNHERICADACS